jgi:hypothetical protein
MDLAKLWYVGRTAMEWKRPTAEEAGKMFAEVGLRGSFWET